MSKWKEETKKDSFIEERIFGLHHYKTTICEDGKKVAEARGLTPKESQERARDKLFSKSKK